MQRMIGYGVDLKLKTFVDLTQIHFIFMFEKN